MFPRRGAESLAVAPPAELSIVVPTYCEAGNVQELVNRVRATLGGRRWELIFVDDDSADLTHQVAKALAERDPQVRCLRRVGRRGLAGACIEGILSSSAPYVAVIDADLQHDEALLSSMLALLEGGTADLVVGTRYAAGGTAAGLADLGRSRLSRWANEAARRLLGVALSDPMSGFFMLRRDIVEAHASALSTDGFKILLDIVTVAGPSLRIAECAYSFRPRHSGDSKFGLKIALEFAGLILSKLSFGVIGPRFLLYAIVGASGLAVHMIALTLGLMLDGNRFAAAQVAATAIAMTNNYVLNNLLTWHDRRLKGWSMVFGFIGFCAIGSAGAIANIGVAEWLFSEAKIWWLAGLAGAAIGALWNYSMASRHVWRTR